MTVLYTVRSSGEAGHQVLRVIISIVKEVNEGGGWKWKQKHKSIRIINLRYWLSLKEYRNIIWKIDTGVITIVAFCDFSQVDKDHMVLIREWYLIYDTKSKHAKKSR